jgi:hypothetical protein
MTPKKDGRWNTAGCLAPWKKNPDDELADRLHKFERVCVFVFNSRRQVGHGGKGRTGNLGKIGKEEFGLTPTQITYCKGRAYNSTYEVQDLCRIRAQKHKPIDSDAMIAALEEGRQKRLLEKAA